MNNELKTTLQKFFGGLAFIVVGIPVAETPFYMENSELVAKIVGPILALVFLVPGIFFFLLITIGHAWTVSES